MLANSRILAYSPAGLDGRRVAAAGSRAGALGVADLGGAPASTLPHVWDQVREFGRRLGRPAFGVRLGVGQVLGGIPARSPANLKSVVVWGPPGTDWGRASRALEAAGLRGVAEVATRDDARAAVEAGFAGLVLAGHEAGGLVGDDSAFVLLQAVLNEMSGQTPVWVRGGIGPAVAAACVAAGATGVVLDGALLLTRESPLSAAQRARVSGWDGSETAWLPSDGACGLRLYLPTGSELTGSDPAAVSLAIEGWSRGETRSIGWDGGQGWPVGQDAGLARRLAETFVTVGGVVQEVARAIDEGLAAARRSCALAPGSALARSHGTRFPIVQGPMTRVSDRASFAAEVANAGALPMLALALVTGEELKGLLTDTAAALGERPWGVGLLGFAPPELRQEQTRAVLATRPSVALIAGGRPDQAREFEAAGIPTYLHAPSPGLLSQYLRDGARRFVFEGRECGGHVGPRSSFLLWEQAVAVLTEAVAGGLDARELHLLFAGGVHDDRSAAAVAALAGPLAERGARVGVLVGTAYLFTREAVASGAIVEGFQREALGCRSTVLLESGPGHLVRVSPTPFAARFERERERLRAEGLSADAIRERLERLNVGRLRVAAKGIDRPGGSGSPLVSVDGDRQLTEGLYMFGQAATLRDRLTTLDELHRSISEGAVRRIQGAAPEPARGRRRKRSRPSDVAIVGMSAVVPGAADVRRFWENTLRGHDAITEVPADRWDWRAYFDPDPRAPDRITSRWGGFVPEIPFDPLRYGMPPASLPSVEPLQLLTLEAVRAALDDAGYSRRPFPRERTAVVLGAGGGAAQLAMGYAFRSYLPLLDTVIPGAGTEALARLDGVLPSWTEDSFPGILLNVAAGRVANRFDLGGANYTVDAACGSSLAAAAVAVRELEARTADVVLLGGVDTVQNPFTYLAFSKTQAFSARGRCRPFDAGADGIVISEAVAVVVLKRLADAERDGDRVYAVIKGLGAGSDGRAKGLTAPRVEGQVRALRRAYEKAGVSPTDVGYVEAHGTGTAAGDLAEVESLHTVWSEAGAPRGACALGSVKSLVGHTKCAAGLVGLINATLALHHRVYPTTIGVETPNPKAKLHDGPFHLSTRARPWLRHSPDRPRRAGVSAFGFGGTNYHAVLEAYEADLGPRTPTVTEWPAELFVWRATDRPSLLADLDRLDAALGAGPCPAIREIAHALNAAGRPGDGPVLALVSTDAADLRAKLRKARSAVANGGASWTDPSGVEFAARPAWTGAPVGVLFPGQGAQTPGMFEELALAVPGVLDGIEAFDLALARGGYPAVGPRVFPPSAWSTAERQAQSAELARPDVAQPALGAVSLAAWQLLQSLGLDAAAFAGHSYGELVALHAGGSISLDALAALSVERGRLLTPSEGQDGGGMAAILAGPAEVADLLRDAPDVVAANWNGPRQTVVSGPTERVRSVVEFARSRGLRAQALNVARAYHSPLVAAVRAPLAECAASFGPGTPTRVVYSNVTAAPYPAEPSQIARQIGDHAASPVRFAAMVESMYEAGVRVFVEAGPAGVLTPLVAATLGDRPHLGVAVESPGRKGIDGLLRALAKLVAGGLALDLRPLTAPRCTREVSWAGGRFTPAEPVPAASTWLVDGNRARPAFGPEPPRFGPGPALPAPPPKRETSPAILPTLAPPSLPVVANGSAPVFEAFQRSMRSFLEVQRTTMLNYLGRPGTEPETPKATPAPSINGNGWVPVTKATAPEHESLGLPTSSEIEGRLLGIVRDRTGYPLEMLRPELDLEADLGIDSIKRVEILGTLRDALPTLAEDSDHDLMEQLSRARTLGAIVERVASRPAAGPSRNGDLGARNGATRNGHARVDLLEPPPARKASTPDASLRRRTLRVVDWPMSDPDGGRLPERGLVVVTDDGRGVGAALASRLTARGLRPVLIRHEPGATPNGSLQTVALDLASEDAVRGFAERVGGEGAVAAIVHALPLGAPPTTSLDPAAWGTRLAPEVRGLFLLARALREPLERTAGAGAAVLAATALGGGFASAGHVREGFDPCQGAVAGFMKTLAREWDGIRARVVDLDPSEPAETLAGRLAAELFAREPRCEVGYLDGRRVAVDAAEEALGAADGGVSVRPGDPIIVTGGARGITAAVTLDLAKRWKPTLLLVGSSPLSDDSALDRLNLSRDAAAAKAAILEHVRREGRRVEPAELERIYQAHRRRAEIRANLDAFRAAGATVEYAAVDVRDADALRSTVTSWSRRYGPAVGLVHGAGVIHDKLLRDKTPESFDRVLGVKLHGAFNLAAAVDPAALRFATFFSSVAGRFGNRGQCDYAAANDALNKLAVWLDRRWPARVVSIVWGPWAGVGMVSDLEAHLGRQGLGMIDPAEGSPRLAEELLRGRKGDVEVVVAGDLGALGTTRLGGNS